jgi:hypothetical protein
MFHSVAAAEPCIKEEALDFTALRSMLVFRAAIPAGEDALLLLSKASPDLLINVVEKIKGAKHREKRMKIGKYVEERQKGTLEASGVSDVAVGNQLLSLLEAELPGIMQRVHPFTGRVRWLCSYASPL